MKRYVVADLHGQLDLLKQIKEYINADDIIYMLGDSGDRGPEPWRTLKASLDDPQIIYLMGNHDLLLIDAINQYLKIVEKGDEHNLFNYIYESGPISLLTINGGLDTLKGWINDPQRMTYYQKLRFLPVEIRLAALDGKHFIYLTHAGYTPSVYESHKVDDYLWDRLHFYDKPEFQPYDDYLLFHGHTPIVVMTDKLSYDEYDTSQGYCSYNNGNKINLDMGAPYTNQTVLVNIDTLEGKVFKVREDKVDGAQNN